MAQTTPFKFVSGVAIVPKNPFASLYQHVIQKDPKLHETLDRLAEPPNLSSNLANPLQLLEAIFPTPASPVQTNWVNLLSNVPDDQTMYFPILAYANVSSVAAANIYIDIQVAHYDFTTRTNPLNFASILTAPLDIPPGANVTPNQILTFAPGVYLRNLDLVYFAVSNSSADWLNVTAELLFQ